MRLKKPKNRELFLKWGLLVIHMEKTYKWKEGIVIVLFNDQDRPLSEKTLISRKNAEVIHNLLSQMDPPYSFVNTIAQIVTMKEAIENALNEGKSEFHIYIPTKLGQIIIRVGEREIAKTQDEAERVEIENTLYLIKKVVETRTDE
ncbi:MAG TPA: hypothetical protein VNK96_00605 [Fimbriimonadales bacterium]|nr:hypothetical protein [Fimbriimonadales bacterium]